MCAASFGVDLLGRTSLREGRTPVVPRTDWKKRSRLKKNSGKYKTHKNSKSSQELKSSGNAGTLLSVSRTHLCFAMRDSPVRIEKAV